MLDHTLFLYGTGISDSNTHFHDDLPIALVGGQAAGIKGGRYIRYAEGDAADQPVRGDAGIHGDSGREVRRQHRQGRQAHRSSDWTLSELRSRGWSECLETDERRVEAGRGRGRLRASHVRSLRSRRTRTATTRRRSSRRTCRLPAATMRPSTSLVGSSDYESAKAQLTRAREQLAITITFWRDRKKDDAVAMLRSALTGMDSLDARSGRVARRPGSRSRRLAEGRRGLHRMPQRLPRTGSRHQGLPVEARYHAVVGHPDAASGWSPVRSPLSAAHHRARRTRRSPALVCRHGLVPASAAGR